MYLDRRHIRGGGKLIILESAGKLLAVFVVDELLEEAVRYSRHNTALHLCFHNLRGDDGADVLGGHISRQHDLTRIRIYLNEGRVRAEADHRRVGLEK